VRLSLPILQPLDTCSCCAVAPGESTPPPQICADVTLTMDVPKSLGAGWTMDNSAFVGGFTLDIAAAVGISPDECLVLSVNKCAALLPVACSGSHCLLLVLAQSLRVEWQRHVEWFWFVFVDWQRRE